MIRLYFELKIRVKVPQTHAAFSLAVRVQITVFQPVTTLIELPIISL